MARRINPDGAAGNARLTIGRSGPNSGRTQAPRIPDAKLSALYKAMNKPKPVRPTTDSIIGSYNQSMKSYNSSQSTNYSLPLGLGIIGGAAVVGANAAKDNARKAAIKKASTKTRKGQTRGR
jgi:hypothetical protein